MAIPTEEADFAMVPFWSGGLGNGMGSVGVKEYNGRRQNTLIVENMPQIHPIGRCLNFPRKYFF
jgi:hypothetical protein